MSQLESSDSEDLSIAWKDLESDLRSVARDLEHDPRPVDVDGLLTRIESFRDRFESSESMIQLADEWNELIEILSDISANFGR